RAGQTPRGQNAAQALNPQARYHLAPGGRSGRWRTVHDTAAPNREILLLQFGLFGAGRIGLVLATPLAAHPRIKLAVVHDPVEAAAREVAAQYEAAPTGDAEAILADPSIDAVVIASPTPTHVGLLTAAVKAGKAVLCEKPVDLDLARVDACWADIKGLNPAVMVGFNRRFDPTFAE